MSPERIDPGRTDFTVRTTPKVVGGLTPACLDRAVALYSICVDRLVPVSSPDAAELVKLLENIFRSVNIALVNELAMLCDRLSLNVWEVVDAAATKPYGFMRFSPGPGLGGHCIPIDPFYLSWRARQFDFQTEFIELAGKVNTHMPYYCAERVSRALNSHRKPVAGSRVLLLGVSYKADVGDVRESPALRLIELLDELGADLAYHDPHVPAVSHGRVELISSPLDDGAVAEADIVCIVTAHSGIDYAEIAERAKLVLDFRNVVPDGDGEGGTAVTERVTVGMVGLGGWGKNLLRNFAALPDADLRWACDADEGRRAAYQAAYPATRFTAELDDVLADPELDAVVLATPVPTHYELARRAMEAGKHVMVEKPMAWQRRAGARPARPGCARPAAC